MCERCRKPGDSKWAQLADVIFIGLVGTILSVAGLALAVGATAAIYYNFWLHPNLQLIWGTAAFVALWAVFSAVLYVKEVR